MVTPIARNTGKKTNMSAVIQMTNPIEAPTSATITTGTGLVRSGAGSVFMRTSDPHDGGPARSVASDGGPKGGVWARAIGTVRPPIGFGPMSIPHRDDEPIAAQAIHEQIVNLAREHDYRRLLELAIDPAIDGMLDELPEDTRRRSRLHLRRAVRWSEQQYEVNRRRMGEARRALDGLDLELARGVLARIDEEFLSEADVERRDALLLEVSARQVEFEDLDELAAEVGRVRPPAQKRRWWRRR